MGAKTAEAPTMFSEKEQAFILGWKGLLGRTPADWTGGALKAGTSDFLNYRRWLAKETTSVDLVLECLGSWQGKMQDGRQALPTFYQLKRRYAKKTGQAGASPDRAPLPDCELCGNQGVVFVPTIAVDDRVYIVDRPVRARNLQTQAWPCNCSRGARVDKRIFGELSPSLRDRGWRNRVTVAGFYALQAQCRALAGVPELAPAPAAFNDEFRGALERLLTKHAPQGRFDDVAEWAAECVRDDNF